MLKNLAAITSLALFSVATSPIFASSLNLPSENRIDPGQQGQETQISQALLTQIRLDLIAESVNQQAGTTRFTRSSEDVILDALASSLVGLGGSSPSKAQYDSFRLALKNNLSSSLGNDTWVSAVVQSANLPDDYSHLNPRTGPLFNIYRNSVRIVLGCNDVNDFNLTLTGNSEANEIRAEFVLFP
jgi:hypothetical protein